VAKILLLYDTQEDDLARDVGDLVTQLGCEIVMIPKSADRGKTRQAKEDAYFSAAAGAIFLITPGSMRDQKLFPSPSVADEMGRAREFFKTTPEKITYLVQKGCQIQSVDQRCYISFERENMRSVLSAITSLIRNLKTAGLLGKPGEMIWDEKVNAYYRLEASGEKVGYFCPKCFGGKEKAVRMAKEHGAYRCPVCEYLAEPPETDRGPTHGFAPGPSIMDEEY